MFSSPAWLLGEDEEGKGNRRFWETSYMLWAYRLLCCLAIGVVIPILRCVVHDPESLLS